MVEGVVVVGAEGFEPPALRSQTGCSGLTELRAVFHSNKIILRFAAILWHKRKPPDRNGIHRAGAGLKCQGCSKVLADEHC